MFASSAGQTWGKTEGNLPAHARAAAAGREVSPAHGVRAGEREAQAHRLHEQERRLHQPAGAGAGEVTALARPGGRRSRPAPPVLDQISTRDSADTCPGSNA